MVRAGWDLEELKPTTTPAQIPYYGISYEKKEAKMVYEKEYMYI